MGIYDINGNEARLISCSVLPVKTIIDGYLYGAGDYHFVEGNNNKTAVYEVIPGGTYKIKSAGMRGRFNVGFFSSIPINNSVPVYYEAHSGEFAFSITAPNNQSIKYAALWFYTSSLDGEYSETIINNITVSGLTDTSLSSATNYPSNALNDYVDRKEGLKTDFTLCTWNIGHFSVGVHKDTDITETDYVEKLKAFWDIVHLHKPDIVAIQEYSRVFALLSGTGVNANDILFGDFHTQFIGDQKNYSCNALFSNHHIRGAESVDYVCNQDAEITHTTLIEATDYYYVRWNMVINGKDILCIATHLAFDNNKPDVLQQDQIDELIAVCSNAPYVIILGDFNTSNFAAFTEAGYEMVNNANIPFMTGIDNILTKGLKIIEKSKTETNLSDHRMYIGKIRIL